MNREAVEQLLDAIRDVPLWREQPNAGAQDRWHRKRLGEPCDFCGRSGCHCEYGEHLSMEQRGRSVGAAYDRARRLYERFVEEFDAEVGELLEDAWLPNESRARLIELLSGRARPPAELDHKALAVLAALEESAASLAEVAERTRAQRQLHLCVDDN